VDDDEGAVISVNAPVVSEESGNSLIFELELSHSVDTMVTLAYTALGQTGVFGAASPDDFVEEFDEIELDPMNGLKGA
jgi:hypothetical protein